MKLKSSITAIFLFLILFVVILPTYKKPEINRQKEQYPNDWFFMQRAFPVGKINQQIYMESCKKMQLMKLEKKAGSIQSVWEFAGPTNIGGRITDVEMLAGDLETMFIGAASGGIFKSDDAGNSWIPIFDDVPSLTIGDMGIAPSNNEIIYVGTGEANAGGGSQSYDGMGIFKSLDGGETWEYAGLEEGRNVGRLVIHPDDPDVVYVAAMGNLFADNPDRGVFKTLDGGQSWEKVLYVSDSTGAIDIVMHPENADVLYTAMWERVRRPNRRSYGGFTCGIFKTTNGGQNWSELTNGLPSPGADIGRIGIDISKSDPQTLYTIYADKTGYFKGVYKTTNGGDNWSQTNDGSLNGCYQSYGWWFGRIRIDPENPNIAYVIGFDLYKTSSGGSSWSNVSSYYVHVDQHELFIHPMNNNFIVLGNDGGLYTSQNAGNSWNWINNLPITQFYTCEIDNQYPNRLYGGTQDNGTNRTMTGYLDDWENIYGGDGFYVLVDPTDNDYVYAEYQYGSFARSTNGGYSFSSATNGISSSDRKNWNTPVVFDPINPEILYYGANRLYRSTNRAVSWSVISNDLSNGPGVNLTYGTISTIAVSPVNPMIIYAGTDDGNVWVSNNDGSNWEIISGSLPERWVTRVAADPTEENTAYVTFSGYRWDEYLPHIFKTTDLGANWSDISGNLPEVPINSIIVDPVNNQTLYVATDAGVYVTYNTGQEWELMGTNLPIVPVNDLKLHNETRKLVAATFGRSMYSYDLYQDTLTTSIADNLFMNKNLLLTLFPNPFTDELKIRVESSTDQDINIVVSDLNGRRIDQIYSGTIREGEKVLTWHPKDLPQLKKGIYMIQIHSGNYLSTSKIIYNPD
ncbi:MAG: T9SS type A sorting domain-containing protein [Bacteroidales bacterium]|nr:T9SS type A sorting domain-containing protein [Bacteroidales bacterium]